MKKLLFFVLVLQMSWINAQTPTFSWAKSLGSTGNDQAYDAISIGNYVLTTGIFTGTVDFDPGAGTDNRTSVGGTDIYITCYDLSGNVVWTNTMGSTNGDVGRSLYTDGTYLYATGSFTLTMDCDPGAGTTNLTSNGGSDVYVCKFDLSTGALVWAKSFGSTSDDTSYSISGDGTSLYVGGTFQLTCDFDPGAGVSNLTSSGSADAFVVKLNSSGSYSWANKIGNTAAETLNTVSIDPSGGVVFIGAFAGTIDFDPGASTYNLSSNGGSLDFYAMKLSGTGAFSWAIRVGGTGSDNVLDMVIDQTTGYAYLGGFFQSTTDFDPGAGTDNHTSNGSNDIFTLILDGSGNYVNAFTVGGTGSDLIRAINIDQSHIYLGGSYAGTVDFDPGAGVQNLTGPGAVLLATDLSGNYVWAGSFGDATTSFYSLTSDNNKGVYATGPFQNTQDFDPGAGTSSLTSSGLSDVVIVKMNFCSAVTPSISSQTNVTCFGGSDGAATISATGGTTFTYSWTPSGGSGATASGLSEGTYTCTVTNECMSSNTIDVTITEPAAIVADAPSNVTACNSYLLPALTTGNYFSGTGGTGTAYSVGNSITSSMTMYVYAESGTTPNCTDENSFTITIGTPVTADTPPTDVRACASYSLNTLSADNNYYTGTGGTGTLLTAGGSVTSTQTIYIYASKDGCTDEKSFVANVFDCIQLDVASCNTTQTNLTDAVYAETVVGATDYRFKIEHAATSYVAGTSTGSSSNFIRLSWLTAAPAKYGTTYTISASAKVGGLWMPFENTCTVTTPATRLQPAYANTTLTTLSDALYCLEVAGATDYRYEIRKASDNTLVTTSLRGTNDNLFRLSWISGGLIQYNTAYKIRVSAYVGGSWQAYGPSVTINSPITSKLSTGSCGASVLDLTTALYCDAVAGATNYRYEIRKASDNSLVAVSTRGAADNLFRLSWVTGIQMSVAYRVKVSPYVGGEWKAYGPECTVFTYVSMGQHDEENISASEMRIFPNPNNGNFTIRTDAPGAYQLLNELGQVIREIEVPESGATDVEGLGAGVYFLRGTETTRKVVVQ